MLLSKPLSGLAHWPFCVAPMPRFVSVPAGDVRQMPAQWSWLPKPGPFSFPIRGIQEMSLAGTLYPNSMGALCLNVTWPPENPVQPPWNPCKIWCRIQEDVACVLGTVAKPQAPVTYHKSYSSSAGVLDSQSARISDLWLSAAFRLWELFAAFPAPLPFAQLQLFLLH